MIGKTTAKRYIGHCLDNALSVRQCQDMPDNARLIGYQAGFEPMFVAVWSYLGDTLDIDEAEEIARDYLIEIGWFSGEPRNADYLL